MFTKESHGTHGLYNKKDGLWWRDEDFDPPYTEPNGEDCYWSRGNGWVFAALVRVLEIIPQDAPHRSEYEKTYNPILVANDCPLQQDWRYRINQSISAHPEKAAHTMQRLLLLLSCFLWLSVSAAGEWFNSLRAT